MCDQRLLEQFVRVFEASAGRYGSPRVQRALSKKGVWDSRKRVARLMREAGLKAVLLALLGACLG